MACYDYCYYFLQVLTDDVETIFRKRKSKPSEIRKVDPKIKSKVGRWKHFRDWFWSYLKVKSDCSEGWNVTFFIFFCKFSSGEVKIVFRECKSEPPNGFHFKVYQKKYFRNWFSSYLEIENKMFWAFENGVLICFGYFFSEQVETVFVENKTEHTKLCKSKFGHRKHFRRWFQFLAHFWKTKLKPLTAKARQSVQKSSNPKLVMVSISGNGFEYTLR